MKAKLVDIDITEGTSVGCVNIDLPSEAPWHYHPTIELSYIVEGTGTYIVGDNIGTFEKGDINLLAPNLPHVWFNSSTLDASTHKSHVIVIHIQESLIKGLVECCPESAIIQSLIDKSMCGLLFKKNETALTDAIQNLLSCNNFERVANVFKILSILCNTTPHRLLAGQAYSPKSSPFDEERMNRVYQHIRQNYQNKITLTEICKIASMAPVSFSRYFKQTTRKSFLQFLNEFRITHACQDLLYSDENIIDIAFQNGFSNIANFNRKFKSIKNMTPKQYRYKMR